MGLDQLLAIIVKEWPTLQAAPVSVVGIVFACLIFGWVVGRFMYGQRIEELKAQIDTLQERLRLRDDELSSAKANLDAAKAKPEEAGRIVDELRERLAAIEPYRLAKEPRQRMIEILRKKPSKVRISIALEATDADPLYRQVVGCFREAGWTIQDSGQIWKLTDAPDSGVAILTWNEVPSDDLATIERALKISGLDAQVRLNDPNSIPQGYPQIVFTSRDSNFQPAARWG